MRKYFVKCDPPAGQFLHGKRTNIRGYYVASVDSDGHEVRHPCGYFAVQGKQRPANAALYLANLLRDDLNG